MTVADNYYRSAKTVPDLVEAWARLQTSQQHFMQVGAHDGITDDYLSELSLRHGWAGIVVEPLPHLYSRLVQTYSKRAEVTVVNTAISTFQGTADFYYLQQEPDGPNWQDQLGSFHLDVILGHEDAIPNVAARVRRVKVHVRPVVDLVVELKMDLDVLVVDTEGHDDQIVQSIDFEADWAPRLIVYEHTHLGGRNSGVARTLRAAGFELYRFDFDTVGIREQR